MNTQKYTLALDQSTKITGYALFENQNLIKHGIVKPRGKEYIQRLIGLRKWLDTVTDTLPDDIFVILEDIQLQQKEGETFEMGVTTYKKLAQCQGILIELLEEKNIPYSLVFPATWKHYCNIKGGNREKQKANAMEYVKNQYGITATQDEVDAICIGISQVKPEKIEPKFLIFG